jgi:hypothetical protein
MDADIKQLLEAMRRENAAAHAETRRYTDEAATTSRQENAAAHEETRREIHESRRPCDPFGSSRNVAAVIYPV